MTGLLVAGLGALLVGLWVAWVYRSRELPIPGRGGLAALRIAVVAIVILLLADPLLPGGAAAGPVTRWLVVDASRSMGVSGESAESPWERARTRVGEADDRTRVALLQDSMGSVANRDSVLAGGPVEGASRLAPLLRRAAESGAREVTVVSDLRIADGLEVAALRDALGVELRFVDVGEAVRSAGIAGLSAPETGPFTLLIGALITFTLLSGAFLSVGNVGNMLAFTPELGRIALAMTLLMTAGEFDLSVGSVCGFTAVMVWRVFIVGWW